LYYNHLVYIVFLWLIQHHIVTLPQFLMHGIYNNMHICKYICFIYICQFTLVTLDWLWYNSGVDFGTVALHMDCLHLEQVERPLRGARQHPWTEQQISLFPVPNIPQGGRECHHTHSSLSGCVCRLDRLHHAGIGRSFAWIHCNIQTVPCRFNCHIDMLTVQCLKQPARVLNIEQLKTHGHWKVCL